MGGPGTQASQPKTVPGVRRTVTEVGQIRTSVSLRRRRRGERRRIRAKKDRSGGRTNCRPPERRILPKRAGLAA